MATLSSALNYALAGLSSASAQSALASRNVANAQDPDYSRRSAEIISLPGGAGPSIGTISRSADKLLFEKLSGATSEAAGQEAILRALDQLGSLVGDPADATSVAAHVAKLQSAVRDFEANPSSALLAAGLVQAAKATAVAVNAAGAGIAGLRAELDREIGGATERVNALLDQFKVVNDAVIRGSGTAAELTDNLDQRDSILKLLSEELGVRTVTRQNNDIAIYTEAGVTLFETIPRRVAFTPSTILQPGASGGLVSVDGVNILAGGSPMASRTGKIVALAAGRDELTLAAAAQLDEVARGLITIFAEQDPADPPALPAMAGLFTDAGSATLPVMGSAGLAERLQVSTAAETTPFLVRDGGFGGPSYVSNTAGTPGYQARLSALQEAFDQPIAFDPAAGLADSASLKSYSADGAGWIEHRRSAATADADAATARQSRSQQALLRVTGVNIDEEMATILDLEKSYQASAKIISTIDAMLATLLEAVG